MKPTETRTGPTGTALQAYLDQLLHEATEAPVESRPAPARGNRCGAGLDPAAILASGLGSVGVAPVGPRPQPTQSALAPPGPPRAGADPQSSRSAATVDGPAELAAGSPPAWGQRPFQALVCRVGPLKVAVPLVKLCEVVTYAADCSPIPYSPPWVMGVLVHRKRQVRVIDLARLILPRQDFDAGADEDPGITDLLLVGDGCWGLGCQEIGEVMEVRPEQVRWRSAAGKRPWLAGTVIERLCALLDVDVLPDLLERGESPV